MTVFILIFRALGFASNRAQGEKLSGLNRERWLELTANERRGFMRQAAQARGGLAAIALAQATPNMNKAKWMKLDGDQQKALISKTYRELGARHAQGMTDDIWYNQLSHDEREKLIHEAAVAAGLIGGPLSVEADGRRAARAAGHCDWPSLTADEKILFLRKSNKTRVANTRQIP